VTTVPLASVALLAAFLSMPCLHPAFAQDAEPTAAQPTLKQAKLAIVGQDGARHEFSVELAQTPRQQEIGLMFRTSIPAGNGMLFVWPEPQRSEMWMKHCPVAEDMVFIGEDNRIMHIAENTVPYSLANVSSHGIAKATLELQGGITAKLGIRVGDLVQSPQLDAGAKP
jgi:uncharacterized membrane protein (UPF0127 family)